VPVCLTALPSRRALTHALTHTHMRVVVALTLYDRYVPQQDSLFARVTVEESLRFSAQWRLPRTTTRAEREEALERTLDLLDLQSVRHMRVGSTRHRGLSGGERKLLSVGVELISSPSVLGKDVIG
jgi:ATP-binding cassette subfamily G (WHITE) protein 2